MSGAPPAAAAVGIGIWVLFGWCWMMSTEAQRQPVVICFGLVTVAAFAGGWGLSMLLGASGLSSIGAAIGGGMALLAVAPVWTAGGRRTLDVVVPGAITGVSVARLGCLFEGCDFGRLADGPMSVAYGPSSRAWEVHVLEYGLSIESPVSLAVHPFGGYLAIWGFLCAAAGQWWRRRTDQFGGGAVVAAVLFCGGGGAIEWLREPATVIQWTDGLSVYPAVYWAMAAALIAGWIWLQYRLGGRR